MEFGACVACYHSAKKERQGWIVIMKQGSNKLGKFLGKWNRETETDR